MEKEQKIKRKEAARLIHEFLREELQEADEIDTAPARKLQDLFDCRVCAGHVMQVYVKGIMDGYRNDAGRFIFGMEDFVTEEEAEEIRNRVFQKECRKVRKTEELLPFAKKITVEEAAHFYRTEPDLLIVDVRTEREYEKGHYPDAVCIPLLSILKNPYGVSERRDRRILFYCEEGYQSEAAARSLLEAGYEQVGYFAWRMPVEC